jgi:predicted 3-demethylubiquinone-9 3-methyltransferase (glyoxalase superfamily)
MANKIVPCLWFDYQAEEAAKLYVSIFRNSRIVNISHYGEAGAKVSGRKKGSVLTIEFEIAGHRFLALNGGPVFKFTPAISFMVECKDQDEIDHYWQGLSAVPEAEQCGWLQDKYGISWQIVPTVLNTMIHDRDPVKSERVMKAMLQMKKLDIKGLRRAYEQR